MIRESLGKNCIDGKVEVKTAVDKKRTQRLTFAKKKKKGFEDSKGFWENISSTDQTKVKLFKSWKFCYFCCKTYTAFIYRKSPTKKFCKEEKVSPTFLPSGDLWLWLTFMHFHLGLPGYL